MVRPLVVLVVLQVALGIATPASAAPEGQLTWGAHNTIAPGVELVFEAFEATPIRTPAKT